MCGLVGTSVARGWVQGSERQEMTHGLAERGEIGCFWIPKDLEEFGLNEAGDVFT